MYQALRTLGPMIYAACRLPRVDRVFCRGVRHVYDHHCLKGVGGTGVQRLQGPIPYAFTDKKGGGR